jgi:hypothetical protein
MPRSSINRWLAGIVALLLLAAAGIFIAAARLAKRFEPYIREQAVAYLRERFHSEAEIAVLHIELPSISPVRLYLSHGRGAIARVEGEGIVLRYNARRDIPPLFTIRKLTFSVDLATLFDQTKHVPLITLDGLKIAVPPKGERPRVAGASTPAASPSGEEPRVRIDRVDITNAELAILPKDPDKEPLDFRIARLRLDSVGPGAAMKYTAELTNPKPPGRIQSTGSFGPWVAGEPGETPLSGHYDFMHADLAVFQGIAGILTSKGDFSGRLNSVEVHGEASVPDFRLAETGSPMPLWAKFEVGVDGTNGNTVLKPVVAKLGSTGFTTSGAIIKHERERMHSIDLNVLMPDGSLRDLLRLAANGPPFMEGRLALKTKIAIPPLDGTVREKLELNGTFSVSEGHFLRSAVQDQIDALSRRGQGQPNNQAIGEVISRMSGAFHLENQVITFSRLSFRVPGADINLHGDYNLRAGALDFHGDMKLRARVSQTMTGWKHWALMPADPFFAKNGAGTYLRIKATGNSKDPKFGLDR